VAGVALLLTCGVCGWLTSLSEETNQAAVPDTSSRSADVGQDVGDEAADAREDPTERPEPTRTKAPPTEVRLPGLGETVTLGKTRWKVDAAEDLGQTVASGNMFIDDLTTTGRFVGIGLVFANDDADTAFVPEPAIVDSAGRVFEPSSDAIMIIDSGVQCILEEVNPGLTKECYWIYELPSGATGLKLRVKSSSFFADTTDIDLGM
jgi:hypothetical protein